MDTYLRRGAVAVTTVCLALLAARAGAFTVAPEELRQAVRLPAGTEIPGLGDEHSRHYSNGDGTIRAVLEPEPPPSASGPGRETDAAANLPAFYSGYSEVTDFSDPIKHVDGYFFVGQYTLLGYHIWERAWVEWNVASIPDGATINSVVCSTYASSSGYPFPTTLPLYDMSNRPYIVTDPLVLYDDAGTGNSYATLSSPLAGWLVWTLNAQAVADLQSRLPGDWFAIGYSHTGPGGNWEMRFNGRDMSNPPRLVVDYSVPLDAQTIAILSPTGTVNQGQSVAVQATVRNNGTSVQNITARFRIPATGYNATGTATNVQPNGGTATITFPNWTAGGTGSIAVQCSTELAGDVVPSNDKLTGTVFVQALDAQTTVIVSPVGTVNQGQVVAVQATVRNNGNTIQNITARFRIPATGYNEAGTATNVPPGGGTATITFPNWTAGGSGSVAVQCSTELTGDVVPTNDKLTSTVFVQVSDAQTIAIVSPTGSVNQGQSVAVQATVRNNGTSATNITARFRIPATGYNEVGTATNVQPGGGTATITFPNWTAGGSGSIAVQCSTELAGDMVPTNDRLTGTVFVQMLDAQTTVIVSPTGTVNQGQVVAVQATVRNNGNTALDIAARFRIPATGYNEAGTATSVQPNGGTATITFPNWTAGGSGNVAVQCSTELAGDVVPANDKLTSTVFVQAFDAQTLAIVSPVGTVNQGQSVAVQATVRNNGNTVQNIAARFKIPATGYDQVGTANNVPPNGGTATITFANWTAGGSGSVALQCSTELAGDMIPANDKLTGSVFVQAYDAQTIAIVSPVGTVNQGQSVTVQATVRNNGNTALDITARFRIPATGYNQTGTANNVPPNGGTATITFANWTAGGSGSVALQCSTELAGDMVPANDKLTGSVFVQAYDAQTITIVSPVGMVNQGQSVAVQATVRNNGNTALDITARFRIPATGYNQTGTANNVPPGGGTATITFADWTAGGNGSVAVQCSTELAGDMVPANDKLTDTVFVQALDAQTITIVSPTGTVNQGQSVAVQATVRNNGNTVQSIAARFRIPATGYNQTGTANNVPPGGGTATITFADWTAGGSGNVAVQCSTELAGDMVPANDKLIGTVFVQTLDAQTTAILSPTGTVNQGQVVAVQATVRNNGNTAQNVTARFKIPATGYDQIGTATSVQPNGGTATITFADWTAGGVGTVALQCSTELAGDMVPANDKLAGTVMVQGLDAMTVAILEPLGVVNRGSDNPVRATVRNNGNTTQQFDVRFTIGDGYQSTRNVSLGSGEQTTVSFGTWTAGTGGAFSTRCSTRLDGDMDNSNDFEADSVTVQVLDAKTVSIDAPSGTVIQGSVNPVRATVRNNGNTAQPIAVRFTIADGSGYSDTTTSSVLDPGEEEQVGFRDWTANTIGSGFQTKCSTRLDGDMDPGNDRALGTVSVVASAHPDIAAAAIIAPVGQLMVNTDVVPRARFRNEGDVETGFATWFAMTDPGGSEAYRRRLDVAALAVGAETTVAFPNWNIGSAVGNWTTRCSCYAVNDVDPSDDWKDGAFTVTYAPPWPSGWYEVEPMPWLPSAGYVKDGGWLALAPEGRSDAEGVIYAAKGYKAGDFYRYDPIPDTWVRLESIPAGEEGRTRLPYRGSAAAADGGTYVYMTKGNNTLGFWRYDVVQDAWVRLSPVPPGPNNRKVKGGTDLVYVEKNDTGYVYLLKGYGTEFYRYNTVADRWDRMDDVPFGTRAKYNNGSFLAYDGATTIYVHQAKYCSGGHHHMFRYDVRGDTWYSAGLRGTPLAGLCGGGVKNKRSKDGGSAAWYDGSIFALKGGNTQQFYRYYPDGDSWHELDTMPSYGSTARQKRVKAGGDMVYFGYGAFFALKGNKTVELWRYVIPTPDASLNTPHAGGVQAGAFGIQHSAFSIAPNPLSAGFATARYSLAKAGPVSITVFDIAGRSVLRGAYSVGRNASSISLDCRQLSSGVYLVRLDAGGVTLTRKMVVQR